MDKKTRFVAVLIIAALVLSMLASLVLPYIV